VSQLRNYVWYPLGSCPRCMRKALWASLASWAVAVGARALHGPAAISDATLIVSIALTALWLIHVCAFAQKQSISSPYRSEPSLTRRSILPIFTRAIAATALSSALPIPAFAISCDTAHGWLACTGHCGNVCYNPAKGDVCCQGVVCGGPFGKNCGDCGCHD